MASFKSDISPQATGGAGGLGGLSFSLAPSLSSSRAFLPAGQSDFITWWLGPPRGFSEFLVFVIANQWVSLCGFELHFPNNWASFCVLVVYLCIFFGKTSIHVMFPFKSFWRVLYIFWLLIPYQTYGLQIFSSILFVAFSLCSVSFFFFFLFLKYLFFWLTRS